MLGECGRRGRSLEISRMNACIVHLFPFLLGRCLTSFERSVVSQGRLVPWKWGVCFSGERPMQMRWTLSAAGLCGLGLGALFFSGGCGGSPTTGMRAEVSGKLKEQSAAHGKRMQEYYAAKKANKAAMKGKAR
jgi:hypothetical protein